MNDLAPNFEMASRFLDLLGPGENFTFQTFDDRKNVKKDPSLNKVLHGTLDEHYGTLCTLNKNGAGIFVMINEGNGVILSGEKSCRTAKNVTRVRAVFTDHDGAPLKPVVESGTYPSIIVNSSPNKWHCYWLCNEIALEEFKPIQAGLAKRFGTDRAVTDLPRVMRIPGFFHMKDTPFMSKIIYPKAAT